MIGGNPDIDEALIERLIRDFYGQAHKDDLLGPIFSRAVPGRYPEDWEPHLQTLMDFWSQTMLKTGRYKGTPMAKHMVLTGVTPAHFERWLALFGDSARRVCPPDVAPQFVRKAELIARSFQMGMFGLAKSL